jgi:hypothetical protein
VATAVLLRLVHSPNAIARAVAAEGLGQMQSDAGRHALAALLSDHDLVFFRDGPDASAYRRVSWFAQYALERYDRR